MIEQSDVTLRCTACLSAHSARGNDRIYITVHQAHDQGRHAAHALAFFPTMTGLDRLWRGVKVPALREVLSGLLAMPTLE
jgi:hypothetical protein